MRVLIPVTIAALLLAFQSAPAAEIGKISNDPVRDTGNVFVSSTAALSKDGVYYIVKGGTVVAQLKPVTLVKGVGAVMQINPKSAVNQVRIGDVVTDSASGAAAAPAAPTTSAPVAAPVQPVATPVVSAPAAPFTTQDGAPPAPFVVPGQTAPAQPIAPATAPTQTTAPVDSSSPFIAQTDGSSTQPAPAPRVEPVAPIAPMPSNPPVAPAPRSGDAPFSTTDSTSPESSAPFIQQPVTGAPTAVAPSAPPAPVPSSTDDSPFVTEGGASGFNATGIQGVETTPPIPPLLN